MNLFFTNNWRYLAPSTIYLMKPTLANLPSTNYLPHLIIVARTFIFQRNSHREISQRGDYFVSIVRANWSTQISASVSSVLLNGTHRISRVTINFDQCQPQISPLTCKRNACQWRFIGFYYGLFFFLLHE